MTPKKKIVSNAAQKGNELTFGEVYQTIDINSEYLVITFNATYKSKGKGPQTPVLLPLLFEYSHTSKKAVFRAHLLWTDIEDYKEISKQQLCDYYYEKCGIDTGPPTIQGCGLQKIGPG